MIYVDFCPLWPRMLVMASMTIVDYVFKHHIHSEKKNGNTKCMSKNRSLNSQIIHVYVSEQIKRAHNIYLKLMQLLFGFIVDWFPFVISLLIQAVFCTCSIFLSIYLYSHHLNVFDVLKMEFMLKLAEFKYSRPKKSLNEYFTENFLVEKT